MRARLNLWRLGYSAFFLLGHKLRLTNSHIEKTFLSSSSVRKMSCEVDFSITMYRRSSISPEGTVLRLGFLDVER